VTVQVLDQLGNLVTTDTSYVTLAIANANGAILGGTTTVPVVGGVAQFTDLSIAKAGIGYTLQASDGSLAGQGSAPFDIRVGAADHLAFLQQPVSVVAGPGHWQPVRVAVVDLEGNVVNVSGSVVTLAVGTNPASPIPGTLHGTLTAKVLHGVATFKGLWLDKAANGYTLTATVPSVTDSLAGKVGASAPFAVTSAAAFKVKLTAGDAQIATVNHAYDAPLTVTVTDVYGNPVGPGVTVTFSAPRRGASVIFPAGTTAVTDANGQASIAVNANTVAGKLQVTASVRVNNQLHLGRFTLHNIADVATHLALSSKSMVTEGIAFNMTVTARDQWGNVATTYMGTVHFTASDSAALLPADLQLTNGSAVVSVILYNARTKPSQSITVTDSSLPNPSLTFNFLVEVGTTSSSGSARQN
jgi:hypothetical protein